MDTPVEDTTVGLREHAAAVATAVAAADVQRPLVVVAHSAGGAFLPIAASACGAQAMIFLCAVVPVEGLSGVDQRGLDGSMVTMPAERFDRDDLGRTLAPPDFARDYYYDDCDPQLAAWAIARLRRQAPNVMAEPFPEGAWPDIPAASILCTEDRCVGPDWSRRVSLERLGVAARELPGGHSPFLSRPAALAELLDAITNEMFPRTRD